MVNLETKDLCISTYTIRLKGQYLRNFVNVRNMLKGQCLRNFVSITKLVKGPAPEKLCVSE